MENKHKILIGLGLVAVAGGIYYLYNKNKTDKALENTGGEKKANTTGSSVSSRGAMITPRFPNAYLGTAQMVNGDIASFVKPSWASECVAETKQHYNPDLGTWQTYNTGNYICDGNRVNRYGVALD